jgi:hypothetical protein
MAVPFVVAVPKIEEKVAGYYELHIEQGPVMVERFAATPYWQLRICFAVLKIIG